MDTLEADQWFPVDVIEDKLEPTPIAQSAQLDAPAGKHGFMKTVDGRWVFDDGTPERLADGTVKRLAIWQMNAPPAQKAVRLGDQLQFYCELNSAYFNGSETARTAHTRLAVGQVKSSL